MKITIKKIEDNKTEDIQHEIKPINILQFQKALKKINEIVSMMETDEGLKNLVLEILNPPQYKNERIANNQFLYKVGGAFESLLVHVPEKAIELISILSGIDLDTLNQQPLDDLFDIYDAIINENDLEKLVKRAKKSFDTTRKETKDWKIFKRKKEQKQPSQKLSPSS